MFAKDAVILHQHIVAPTLQDGDGHGGIAGDGLDLLLALFAAISCQALQSGNGDGQQLDNNGAVDVGLHAQCKDGCFGKGAAGHDVVQAQDGGAELIDIISQQLGVHIGDRNGIADAEDQKDQCGEDDFLAQFGDGPGLADRLNHLRSPLPFLLLLRSRP